MHWLALDVIIVMGTFGGHGGQVKHLQDTPLASSQQVMLFLVKAQAEDGLLGATQGLRQNVTQDKVP